MCVYVKGASSTTPWINILSYDTVTVPASLTTIKQRVEGLNMMFICCTLSELFVIQITSDNLEKLGTGFAVGWRAGLILTGGPSRPQEELAPVLVMEDALLLCVPNYLNLDKCAVWT